MHSLSSVYCFSISYLDIENCPRLNSLGAYIAVNLEDFENGMAQMPILQKFPEMFPHDLKDFYVFCNVFKFKEVSFFLMCKKYQIKWLTPNEILLFTLGPTCLHGDS